MKCSWQTFLSLLKGKCPYYALIGLVQTTCITGGFDSSLLLKHKEKVDSITLILSG